MNNEQFIITFPNTTPDEANRFARSLADELKEGIPGLEKAEPGRTKDDTQDFGATIVLILGTAAAGAVAKGIQTWLARTGTDLDLNYRDGTVKLKNVNSKDAAEIARALSKSQK